MANVSPEYIFWCHDGRTVKNTQELAETLKNMNDDTFVFHVNANNNDFSNWVSDIIQDKKLARDLSKALDQAQAAQRVMDRIAFLTSKLI